MAHTFNCSIQEMDAGVTTVQGYLWLRGEFGASLRYVSYLSQNNNFFIFLNLI